MIIACHGGLILGLANNRRFGLMSRATLQDRQKKTLCGAVDGRNDCFRIAVVRRFLVAEGPGAHQNACRDVNRIHLDRQRNMSFFAIKYLQQSLYFGVEQIQPRHRITRSGKAIA